MSLDSFAVRRTGAVTNYLSKVGDGNDDEGGEGSCSLEGWNNIGAFGEEEDCCFFDF